MLLTEDRLSALVAQLRTLRSGDRRAILARLSSAERTRVVTLLRQPVQVDGACEDTEASDALALAGYSPDLAQRLRAIAATDEARPGDRLAVTSATRDAVRRLLAEARPATPPQPHRSSLVDILASRLAGGLRR